MHAGDIQYLPCTVGELHMGGSVSLPASPTTLSSILSYSLGTGVHDTTARYLRRHIVSRLHFVWLSARIRGRIYTDRLEPTSVGLLTA